jgi:fructose-specific phosphotransferase system IIC component
VPSAEHWRAILVCGRATLGDVVIALVGFWAVAASARTRSWVLRPTAGQLTGFVAVGVLITILMEWLATQVLDRWTYAESMPVIPLLGVGLSPLLQWVVLPPIVVWFVRRQLT